MMTTELLMTHHDIVPSWHERYFGIIARFVASFSEPLSVWGVWDDAGQRILLGRVVAVAADDSGMRVNGNVEWVTERPRGHVKMSWAVGPGPDRVSLTSGHVDAWPHQESFDWVHETDADEGDVDEYEADDWSEV